MVERTPTQLVGSDEAAKIIDVYDLIRLSDAPEIRLSISTRRVLARLQQQHDMHICRIGAGYLFALLTQLLMAAEMAGFRPTRR